MKRIVKFIGFDILLVFLDQITKYWAQISLKGTNGISIIPGIFRLQYLENRGAAFGMFQNKLLFLGLMTVVILAGLIYVYLKVPRTKRFIPIEYICIFISAGAIGNFIDRILHNYVTDFFYFELIDFPIFNVADCYVTVCAILLLVLGIFYYKEEDFEFLTHKKEQHND